MQRDQVPMAAKILVFSLFGVIVLFIYILSSEYHSNQYQQAWVSENLPWLDYLLNGYLAAALVGILIGGAVLLLADYLRNKRPTGGLRTGI